MHMLRKVIYGITTVIVVIVLFFSVVLPEFVGVSYGPAFWNSLTGRPAITVEQSQIDARLQVPPGFELNIFANDLPFVRFIKSTPSGDLIVTTPRKGEVILLGRDNNGDNVADNRNVILAGLDKPHGVEIFQDWLYIAEGNAVGRVKMDWSAGTVGEYEHILTDLPDGGNHWTRTIGLGPNGWMYLSLGSTCNVCVEENEMRAAMVRFRPDGSELEIYATGLRNSVGFDWSPLDGLLYATDNGRDLLGDDFPPCELNQIKKDGFYGFPFFNGDNEWDPDFGVPLTEKERAPLLAKAIKPVFNFRAHNAPLGMAFVGGNNWPESYQNDAVVALHGSWNRSEKDGYKVVRLSWDDQGVVSSEDLISGYLTKGDVIGRPVDVEFGKLGELYISDDFSGVVYRLQYTGKIKKESGAYDRVDNTVSVAQTSKKKITVDLNAPGYKLLQGNGCLACHSVDGSTQGLPLNSVAGKFDEASLSEFFKSPTPPMPSYELTRSEVNEILSFLESLAAN